jgi:hypothetical protein
MLSVPHRRDLQSLVCIGKAVVGLSLATALPRPSRPLQLTSLDTPRIAETTIAGTVHACRVMLCHHAADGHRRAEPSRACNNPCTTNLPVRWAGVCQAKPSPSIHVGSGCRSWRHVFLRCSAHPFSVVGRIFLCYSILDIVHEYDAEDGMEPLLSYPLLSSSLHSIPFYSYP